MSLCKYIFALVASMMLTSGSLAAQTIGDSTLGGGLSVFGATVESSYRIEEDIRFRGVFMGGLGFDGSDQDDDGNSYNTDINLAAAAALLDYYPTLNGWRVSGGLLINLSDVTGTATGSSTDPLEVNGETFPVGRVEGEGRFVNQIAPIVTTGYDYDIGNDWVLSGEIGAIYTGGIETEFSADSAALQDAIADDDDFQNAQSDAADIKLLPYLSVSVSFRF